MNKLELIGTVARIYPKNSVVHLTVKTTGEDNRHSWVPVTVFAPLVNEAQNLAANDSVSIYAYLKETRYMGLWRVEIIATHLERHARGAANQDDFAELTETVEGTKPVKYSIKATYEVGDLIDHPKFGAGQVIKHKSPTKIEVLFFSGKKLLMHSL